MNALRLLLPILLVLSTRASEVAGQQQVVVADRGPGVSGRLIEQALNRPHRLFPPSRDTALIAHDSTLGVTALVLDRAAIIEGTVNGDVIVVNGDLHVHPRAHIRGRAIAIGGGVYVSTLAIVDGATTSFRDHTFRVTPTANGWELTYQPLEVRPGKPFSLPGLYGLRIPTYDRTNGLSLPVAPMFSFDSGRIELEPGITWRTNLGKVDPSLIGRVTAGRRTRFEASALRGTFSNERWIHTDLVNSLQAIVFGTDSRNWWRADRAELRGFRLLEATNTRMEPFLGARLERAWSVGPYTPPEHTPWSLRGRRDPKHMARPNPPIDEGSIASALLGTELTWAAGPITATGNTLVEVGSHAGLDRRFTQATLDGSIGFPTFSTHRFELETHVVLTAGDTAPRQRFAYLGGPGTVQTMELLEQGGDELFFLEARYIIPVARLDLPVLGPPTLTLRHVLGGAAVQRFPTLTQNIGVRVALGFVRVEIVVDPVKPKVLGGVGLSMTR